MTPMTREQLWSLYTAKNPHWLTEGATLTPAGLKKLFDQTFECGHRLGVENGKVLAETKETIVPPAFDKKSLFGKIFGM